MNRDVQLNFCQTVLAYIRDEYIHVDASREDDCILYLYGWELVGNLKMVRLKLYMEL